MIDVLWCVLCTPSNEYAYDLKENFFSTIFIRTAKPTTRKVGETVTICIFASVNNACKAMFDDN